ncbi:PREDICTED: interactor of constitutive active ROPs 4 isoform X2 [Tarenaya hassleriana]|uniref:interactor of constitutive active ROPs 4 isoform X2 n=1 Tax=Tarenaya hassleriana TaxID=28532 RepID=UPI00053C6003|nr:PREDICTED: interactor of constitutive active ROPs 4 isoform X2 [Tarenaya hassleriana]
MHVFNHCLFSISTDIFSIFSSAHIPSDHNLQTSIPLGSSAEIKMPRSRGPELPQMQSPRLRTSTAFSDPNHRRQRPITDRSPQLGLDRGSPRSCGSHNDLPPNQKKLGTRISDLESQLGQAQDELRALKKHLATTESAKKHAQEKLKKNGKKPNNVARLEGSVPEPKMADKDEVPGEVQLETDVFEVPVEKITREPEEVEKPKADEVNMLKAKLYDLEKERESLCKENESLKNQLSDTASEMRNAKAKQEEMAAEMDQIGKELEGTRENEAQMKEKLESTKEAKQALEAEMKKMTLQTEQWRKAADAAAEALAGGVEVKMNGRVSESCGSMDKNFTQGFFHLGSDEHSEDGLGSGKRKGSGSGIRMLGDLWRKKGQK